MIDSNPFFKSIVEQDNAAVVVCNLEHVVVYMNPAAIQMQAKHGGGSLVGRSLMDCHNSASQEKIRKVVEWFSSSASHNKVFTYHNAKHNRDVYMVALRDELQQLIGYYEKHECRTPESVRPYYLEP